MKALSIRQPWVWAILHAGKDIENRDWKPTNPARRFRGRFLIHASSGMTNAEYEDGLAFFHAVSIRHPFAGGLTLPRREELCRGGIVGAATLVDIVEETSSPWFMGPAGLMLGNVKPAPFVPCKGALGFFDVPSDVAAEIRRLAE